MSGPPGPPDRVVIGLDVGTTASKAVAFGMGSDWRHTASREYPLLQPHPGQQVQDLDTMLAAAAAVLTESAAAADGAEVVAVSVSTAMHGLIGLDAACEPLTPLITWADARASEQARPCAQWSGARDASRGPGLPCTRCPH